MTEPLNSNDWLTITNLIERAEVNAARMGWRDGEVTISARLLRRLYEHNVRRPAPYVHPTVRERIDWLEVELHAANRRANQLATLNRELVEKVDKLSKSVKSKNISAVAAPSAASESTKPA